MDVRKGHPDFLVTWKDASLFTSSHDSMTVMTLGGPSGRVEDRSGPFRTVLVHGGSERDAVTGTNFQMWNSGEFRISSCLMNLA